MFKQPRLLAPAALSLLFTVSPLAAADSFTFDQLVSAGANACLPDATAKVIITSAASHTADIVSIQIRGDLN